MHGAVLCGGATAARVGGDNDGRLSTSPPCKYYGPPTARRARTASRRRLAGRRSPFPPEALRLRVNPPPRQ